MELLLALLECDQTIRYTLHGWSWSLDAERILNMRVGQTQCSLGRIPGFVKRWYWNHCQRPRLETLLGEFEVFHSADPFLPPTARKSVATVHDFAYRLHPEWFTWEARAWHENNRRSLDRASAIIVPSMSTLDDLGNLFPELVQKTHVVHWPVGRQFRPPFSAVIDSRVSAGYALPERYALYVGTIEPRKNLSRLLEAFEKIPELRSAGLILLIAGKVGWKSGEVVRRIKILEAQGIVRHLGHVADADLPSIYRLATLFVYPSLFEGYGFPVLEAMACGTPVVASSTSSMQELTRGAALLVDPFSAESLADAIRQVSSDDLERTRMSQRGMALAAGFSPEAAARKTQEIYADITS